MRLRFTPALLALSILFGCGLSRADDLALVGAKIYLSPSEPPIENGTILVHSGHILSVGPIAEIKVPRGTTVIDCKGLVVTAGFWNSHVHILLPGLLHAEKLSSEQITSQLQQMLTRWGFTTVFDIASVLQNTNLIRRRIEEGEVKGPRILTVGEPFWVKGGTPIYVKKFLEENHVSIPEVESTAQAKERVRQQIRDGADGIKIFANSVEFDDILTMPLDLAQAIAAEAHRAGKPVFAHVSNNQGIEVAIQSGVDILAHTTAGDDPWSPSFVQRLTAAHMALTPTLTLWDVEFKKGNASPDDIEKAMTKAAAATGGFLSSRRTSSLRHRRWLHPAVRHLRRIHVDVPRRNEFPADSCFAHHQPRPALRLCNSQRTYREKDGCRSCGAKCRSGSEFRHSQRFATQSAAGKSFIPRNEIQSPKAFPPPGSAATANCSSVGKRFIRQE